MGIIIVQCVLGLIVLAGLIGSYYLLLTETYAELSAKDWPFWLLVCGYIALAILMTLLSLLLWNMLLKIFCSYWYGRLVARIEEQLGMDLAEIHETGWLESVVDGVKFTLLVLGLNLLLFTINIVPIIGTMVAFLGGLYLNSYLFGRDFFAYPMDVRDIKPAARKEFFKAYRYESHGLGAFVLVTGLIPFVGAVMTMSAAVGACLLYRDLKGESFAVAPAGKEADRVVS